MELSQQQQQQHDMDTATNEAWLYHTQQTLQAIKPAFH